MGAPAVQINCRYATRFISQSEAGLPSARDCPLRESLRTRLAMKSFAGHGLLIAGT